MSNLVVLSFESAEEANEVKESLRKLAKQGGISLSDTAVVVKDEDGGVHVDNQVSHGTMVSTGVGALLGVLLGGFLFPLGGLLLGAAGGALVGRLADLGVDGKFVKDVSESLKPGSSALFVLVRDADPTAALATLRQYKGKVLQTTLSSQAEANLKDALGDKSS